ncbi:MAG: pyrroloquinoline-quinone synthase PqqC [Pirellulales bacterium]|nr:pyrroloquinoline-quinone synthase PqqC [Pirellulales bacterium]
MQFWSREEFIEKFRQVGQQRYHDRHPFHQRLHAGELTRAQIQCWVANRFYYQKNIPIKDALLTARCPVREVRRHWVQRIIDHDGCSADPGGIERWLRLGEGVGLAREDLEKDRLLLPGVRYAVDAYVHFVGSRSWVEGVASSLTELFAPQLMKDRLIALETHYRWIDPATMTYFRCRPPLASRDSENGLDTVIQYCDSLEQQQRAVAALQFKCDVLWAQLDAVYQHCVAPAGVPLS